jgi:hypothetical protein
MPSRSGEPDLQGISSLAVNAMCWSQQLYHIDPWVMSQAASHGFAASHTIYIGPLIVTIRKGSSV